MDLGHAGIFQINQTSLNEEHTMTDTNAPESFSWGKLIADMKLKGLSAMIACHTEPVRYDAAVPRLELQVVKNMQELVDSPAMERLAMALKDHFGEKLELEIGFGPAKRSPAAIAFEKRVGRFTQAYTNIAEDDLVAKLIEEFGARVIVESVTPARKMVPASP